MSNNEGHNITWVCFTKAYNVALNDCRINVKKILSRWLQNQGILLNIGNSNNRNAIAMFLLDAKMKTDPKLHHE